MHTQLPEEVLGAATVARCRNLWWSLYTMDRHFSPSLGLPMTTKDSEITTLISSSSSNPRDLAFSLQVRITRMRSFIISSMSSSYLDFHLTLTDNHAMKLSIELKKLLWAHS